MPIYEYRCTNHECTGPKLPEDDPDFLYEVLSHPDDNTITRNLPQEKLVPMKDMNKWQQCKFCGRPALFVQWHGKNHIRFHFNYLAN